ncbi:hypothetical protein CO172_02765 [Candidatus Uhrbacteria bacterium CG_4_9_14_3_um_filter_36_7]|uniref:Uncharacterized protein n=1 Tax=Candidatus Uhrbacteria bacterium CG_4_9_14_3_um_filter_36_7 TaxID=1975033 RepID=A0A2M7XH51_9BACT|nr:MAG: hypothetical protein CO172_02765 [Candidatus Uhrbacteria bacterium CG_4_9_14_3_um_filter_36_7]
MRKFFLTVIALAQVFLFFPLSMVLATSSTTNTSGFESGLTGAQKSVQTIGTQTGTQANLPTLVGNIINVVLGILGIVLVGMLIWAGVMYLTSKGEAEKTKTAIKLITQSIIGIIIILAAYAIANFVITALTTAATA